MMDNQNSEAVNRAFSAQTPHFDDDDRSNVILQWMRSQVYSECAKYLNPGDVILDINAGTGIDAVHFAKQGHSVTAVDIANGMVAETQKKIDRLHLSHLVHVHHASFTDLSSLAPKKFNFIFSNFGGLNCIQDLSLVAEQLKQLIRPNGYITMVIMPKVCPWEMVQMVKGNFSFAFRRFKRNGTLAHIEGNHFLTYYHSPSSVITSFGERFTVVNLRGLASLTPAPHSERFPKQFPRLFRFLTGLDERVAAYPPFDRWADHYILTLQYRPEMK